MNLYGHGRDHAIADEAAHDSALDRGLDRDESRLTGWPGKRTRAAGAADGGDHRIADLRRVRAASRALGPGGGLSEALAAEYGALLETDLTDVRIRHGGVDGDAARELGAIAFTHGTDIGVIGDLDVDSAFGRH